MEKTMNTVLILIFSHLVGDYVFQSDFIANFKGKLNFILMVHCGLWAGSISTGLWLSGLYSPWAIPVLFVGHFYIDRWKARKEDKTHALTKDLYLDQALHGLQVVVAILIYFI
jgi:hypothetical protein